MEWRNEPPNRKGWYWFYGEWRGSMGCHYGKNKSAIEPKMVLVEIWDTSNNALIGVAEGRFVSIEPFDESKLTEGYVGYWLRTELPISPLDKDGLFD